MNIIAVVVTYNRMELLKRNIPVSYTHLQRKRTGWEYGISASTMSIPTWHPSAYAKDGGIITTASIPWA